MNEIDILRLYQLYSILNCKPKRISDKLLLKILAHENSHIADIQIKGPLFFQLSEKAISRDNNKRH